jgi:hypothetical protein
VKWKRTKKNSFVSFQFRFAGDKKKLLKRNDKMLSLTIIKGFPDLFVFICEGAGPGSNLYLQILN